MDGSGREAHRSRARQYETVVRDDCTRRLAAGATAGAIFVAVNLAAEVFHLVVISATLLTDHTQASGAASARERKRGDAQGRSKRRHPLIGTASTAFHLLGALRRAAGRVILMFFLTLIVVGGLAEGVHFLLAGSNGTLTHILSAALAVGWAIAVSLLVLVGEVVRGLISGVREGVKDVEREVGDAGKLVGNVVQSIEGHGQKK